MEKKNKNYQIGDKTYTFNSDKFARLCTELSRKSNQKKTSEYFLIDLGEAIGDVSPSTIKGWMYGNNSPSTIDMVERVANAFELDKMALLCENGKVNSMNNIVKINYNDMTIMTISEIYGMFVEAIEKYRETDGFSEEYYMSLNDEENNDYSGFEEFESYSEIVEELDILIRKSRVYLPKEKIEALLALAGKVYSVFYAGTGYFENIYSVRQDGKEIVCIEQEDGSVIEKTWDDVEPTEYETFLNGREDSDMLRILFLNTKVTGFYDSLESILSDYMPA